MINSEKVQSFWKDFEYQANELYQLVFSDIHAAFEKISELTQQYAIDYVYELTCDDNHAILIFTPESDKQLAKQIDFLVGKAPQLNGWLILPRRQKKSVKDAITMSKDLYDIDITNAMLSSQQQQDKSIWVTLYTQTAQHLDDKAKTGFVEFFLEHSLGEDFVMNHIQKANVSSNSPNDGMPLQEFVDYITEFVQQ